MYPILTQQPLMLSLPQVSIRRVRPGTRLQNQEHCTLSVISFGIALVHVKHLQSDLFESIPLGLQLMKINKL
jgi:hypothetical protein